MNAKRRQVWKDVRDFPWEAVIVPVGLVAVVLIELNHLMELAR